MASQRRRDLLTGAVLVALVGLLVVPQMAVAHKQTAGHKGSAFEIHHGKGSRAANVSGGRLQTTVHGGWLDASTFTGVMASGTGTGSPQVACTGDWGGAISAVTATGNSGDVITLTADADFDGTDGDLLWQAELASTVQGDFGVNYVSFGSDLEVSAPATTEWIIYGFCFADFFGSAQAEGMDRIRGALADA